MGGGGGLCDFVLCRKVSVIAPNYNFVINQILHKVLNIETNWRLCCPKMGFWSCLRRFAVRHSHVELAAEVDWVRDFAPGAS